MKSTLFTILVAGITAVSAMPPAYANLDERQLGMTSNDIKDGQCKDVTFIMARGSTEMGNMGQIPGPPTCSGLKMQLGADKVACQGIGTEDGYPALLPPNFMPKNTDDTSIAAATKIISMAASQCPNTKMVVAGYSQGTAVVDNAIQGLPQATQDRIAGVVLFGFTRNSQDNAQIPGYPKEKTKIFCAAGDLVCDNTLIITPTHLSYAVNAPAAASFLASMVQKSG